MNKLASAPLARRILLLVTISSLPTAACADHLAPSTVGAGGGMSVFPPDTLEAQHWAAGLRLTYTRPEQRSDAVLAGLAKDHVHAHNSDYTLNASAGVAYGLSHHLTVSAELPYVRHDSLREGAHHHTPGGVVNGVEQLGNVAGFGDVNLLAKYRMTEGDGPSFAIVGGIKLPTGSTHRRSRDGERLETEHQPGSGSWDPLLGASGSVPAGPVQLTASALYQLSTHGAQHTRLGNRLQAGVAVSHRFGPAPQEHAESHNCHHGDELDEQHGSAGSSWDAFVELGGEWEGRQKIEGLVEDASGGTWAFLAPGVRFSSARGWSMSAALALPVWQDIRESHPNNRYRLTLALGRAF